MKNSTAKLNGFQMANFIILPVIALLLATLALSLRSLFALRPASLLRASAH